MADTQPETSDAPMSSDARADAQRTQEEIARERASRAVSPPADAGDVSSPTELAQGVKQAIEALLAATRQPGTGGFPRVGDVQEVVSALQSGLVNLPQLLHELGSVLEHTEGQPGTRQITHVSDAVRSLERAADTARRLTGPVTGELSHVCTTLVTLESHPIRRGQDNETSVAEPDHSR